MSRRRDGFYGGLGKTLRCVGLLVRCSGTRHAEEGTARSAVSRHPRELGAIDWGDWIRGQGAAVVVGGWGLSGCDVGGIFLGGGSLGRRVFGRPLNWGQRYWGSFGKGIRTRFQREEGHTARRVVARGVHASAREINMFSRQLQAKS